MNIARNGEKPKGVSFHPEVVVRIYTPTSDPSAKSLLYYSHHDLNVFKMEARVMVLRERLALVERAKYRAYIASLFA
eukprot:CAMPEP_0178934766 /NCGR_PEP_ID=MMETSP0786-20121207/24084_1 /TAXON_ID=186022 /ORGANISM="Thalassionema frauenfeldii, Strain CCMP 1798" /LENGTH=76 /DNA_ID=CAMNT_0020612663 /DNA_START=92 /DNA_END=322 /DNA_ORIENTATION=+